MRKLLILNRSEIARRIIRTARKMAIRTVAVASDPDLNALYVQEADEWFHLKGETPAETYLNLEAIETAIIETGSDALHPGYGFLSERVALIQLCERLGVTFVGPAASAVEKMGDKITSKSLMQEGGVPTIPGFYLEGLKDQDVKTRAQEIGFPVMVKAAAGGGGKGMRRVECPQVLLEAIEACQRESRSSFGDDRVFVEKFVESPRHIEVQILADAFGSTVALGERECSIQRRNQKIVEECPSSFVDPPTRARLESAAIQAASVVDYVSAGTVEFVMGADRQFYFLEMNTRLQVEHPVTEMVYGVDIVEEQLRVAMGRPLSPSLHTARPQGHSIEVRVYAEEPLEDFMPAAGKILGLHLPKGNRDLRLECGIQAGDEISIHYDPMLMKIVAYAEDRELCISRLQGALEQTAVLGIETNTAFLKDVLSHEAFYSGETHTGFIEEFEILDIHRNRLREIHQAACLASTLWLHERSSHIKDGFSLEGSHD